MTEQLADPSLDQQFEAFDASHPMVYRTFRELACTMYSELLQARPGEMPVFGAKFVWERLRWEVKLGRLLPRTPGFDLDNDLVSRYARKLAAEDARFKMTFRFRALKKPVN